MGKPSRKQRKQFREKRVRAENLGLVLAPATPKGDRSRRERESRISDSGSEESGAAEQLASSTDVAPAAGHFWSSWPMSIKLLLVGILTLIAIGLYRRYTEDSAPSGDDKPKLEQPE